VISKHLKGQLRAPVIDEKRLFVTKNEQNLFDVVGRGFTPPKPALKVDPLRFQNLLRNSVTSENLLIR